MKNVLTARLRVGASSIALMGRTFLVAALVLLGASSRARAQDLVASNSAIDQMRAAAGGQLTVSRSRRTGLADFVAAPRGAGILVPDPSAITAADRALSFVESYGQAFGLRSRGDASIDRINTDDLGIDHVRMRQVVSGVPVTGGEIVVHLRGPRVLAANGKTLGDLENIGVIPAVASNEAENTVRAFATGRLNAPDATLSEPRLEIFNQGLLNGRDFPTRLAWFVEVRELALREFVWIDAKSKTVLLHFSQLADAKNRSIYNGNNTWPLPGTLMRVEGGAATGDADANNAYTFAGLTYDYYFTNHGRDSFNNAGAALISTVHHCPDPAHCPYSNAFWNGAQMVYGDGFASADDVVAHELTHAVTEYTANLYYYMQSGALNESFSDIFGETVDLGNGAGNDTPGVRWQMGEDLPPFPGHPGGGALRSMLDPTLFGDPGKMSDPQFQCDISPSGQDAGGVHTNSGVPNHAYALMVDGGTFNSITVAGIGITKAAKIQYRALTQYLTSASDFLDNYNALQQACADLVGTIGITSGNCAEVKKALDAVQMSNVWPCAPIQATPPSLCSAGQTPVNLFFDNFESGLGNWTISGTGGVWSRAGDPTNISGGVAYATSGVDSLWGYDPQTVADSRVALSSNLPTIPSGARLQFNHSFGFDMVAAINFDGGVLEYSTNGGASWSDASGFYAAGANYTGAIADGFLNPLALRQAFVRQSYGYTASQYNLSGLAGQSSVRFRFRIGADDSFQFDDYGWFIDDFRVYTCVAGAAATPAVATNTATAILSTSATLNGSVNPNLEPTTANFEYGLTTSYGNGTPLVSIDLGASPVALSAPIAGLAACTTYHFRARAFNGHGTTNGPDATFLTRGCPAPSVTTGAATGVSKVGATLNGTVNANAPPTSASFQYGPTASYGLSTSVQSVGGNTVLPMAAVVGGLTCGTTYHYRTTATSVEGTSNAADQAFQTAACAVGGVSGTITDASTGLPLAGVSVRIDSVATNSFVEAVVSGADGVWHSLTALPNGSYRLRTTNSLGYMNERYNNVPCIGVCSTSGETLVAVTSPIITTGIAFALDRGPSISGAAIDDGTGLGADAFINVYDSSGVFVTQTRTDQNGFYRTEGLTPGTYYLLATSIGIYVSELYNNATCYQGCSVTSGAPVVLTGTSTTGGINFSLTRGGFMSGLVTAAATGAGLPGVTVNVFNAAGTLVATKVTSGAGGAWGLSGNGGAVPPGNYYAKTSNSLGYTDELYNNLPCPGSTCTPTLGNAIVVTAGPFTPGIDFALDKPPVVTTGAASAIAPSGATLNGTVNPNGAASTGAFEYGLTTSYGSTTPAQGVGSGMSPVAFLTAVSGLACNATYHFRAVGTNVAGTTNGSDATFTTAACPPPTVSTGAASGLSAFQATLNGTVNPNGTTTTASFEIGLTTAYGGSTPSQSLGSGLSNVPLSATVTGLTCATTYHFRARATNTVGPVNGSDATFTTTACFTPVQWTHVVGVVAAGNSLSKTSGVADFNAGAISLQSLPSGDGSVEFTATETNTFRMAGLGNGDTNQSYTDLEYGIVLTASGGFGVYESGTLKTGVVAFSAGDKFSVGVESGVVKYRRNGALFYTSLIAPVYPLVVDTSLSTIGATVTDARILGFVEPPPTLTINDVSIPEGNTGIITNAVFTVTLSSASLSTVTVVATTADNTAQAGSDYTATGPTTLTFVPGGPLTQTFSVPVLGDTVSESNETFFVNLSGATNAAIGDAQGVGTIVNDDLPPAVTWTHIVGVVAAGNSLSKTSGTADFNAGAISLQSLPSGDGSVEFTATEANTFRIAGLGNGDTNQSYTDLEYGIVLTASGGFGVYESGTLKTGVVAFSAGDKFSVGVESGVVKYRRNGALFYTSLIAPVYPLVVDTSLSTIGATVTDARILGFVEPPPTLTINDVSIPEGNTGIITNAVFTVTLSSASLSTVTVVATTADNTAQAGSDYTATGPTTLTFVPGGPLTQTFSVPVLGDTVSESNETFFVNLSGATNAAISDAQGVGTIVNDDLPPAVTWTHIVGVVAAGNSLSKTSGVADFNAGAISLQSLPSGDGSVEFTATETYTFRMAGLGNGDTNQSYTDLEYGIVLTASGGFGVYESGTLKTGVVAFSAGDKFSVGVESGVVKYRRNGALFYTSLIAPVYPLVVDTSLSTIGATVTDARILGFVEPPPTLTINDVSIPEGNTGIITNAVFTVTLSSASLSTVTVVATTADNTAQAGSDYTATGPTTLTFVPGGPLTQTFSVPVLGDTVSESNETFFVNLSGATNAAISDAQGVGTIVNDDLPPAVTWTHIVGVVAAGNSLSKTSGVADFNAGAISLQSLPSGDGSVEFTATETYTFRMAGLGNGDTNQSYTDLEYGIVLTASGGFGVYESGTLKTGVVAFSAGDKFSVGVESGVVKYRRNGALFYTSLIAPVYPLVVDTSLSTIGATVTDARILGFVEPPPTLTINDVSIPEGNTGIITNAVFTVTLSSASLSTVTVVATTADNTAQAGSDYTATGPTTLTFVPGGPLTQTFSVPVLGDTVSESNETFFVNLSGATNAAIGDAQGVGTIVNDDLPPAVTWTHIVGVVAAGNSLSKTSGTADFNAGAISLQSLPSGDGSVEFTATETYTFRMAGLGNGDTNQSYTDLEYGIVLTASGGFGVYESGTLKTGVVAFSAGDKFSVGVESGVVKYRRNGALFYTSLIAPVYPLVVDTSLSTIGATVTDARILGFVEPPPTLTINDVSIPEGNTGIITNAVFTVTLSSASLSTVTVVATTADNTAQAGSDYTATGPTTLTFVPGGPLTQTFSVPVLGDTVSESNETFFVNLSGATNAAIGDAQGVGTIVNDDLPPAVTWTHIVGVVAAGNSLSKTSGTADFNAGAISLQSLPSGDGSVEFTATEANTFRIAGLGNGDTNQSYTDLEYGIVLTASGGFGVYESGTLKTGVVAFSAGDKFSVGVESGVVKYRRNGALFYTSLIAPVYPLVVDTSLSTIGATVTDARILGFIGPPIP